MRPCSPPLPQPGSFIAWHAPPAPISLQECRFYFIFSGICKVLYQNVKSNRWIFANSSLGFCELWALKGVLESWKDSLEASPISLPHEKEGQFSSLTIAWLQNFARSKGRMQKLPGVQLWGQCFDWDWIMANYSHELILWSVCRREGGKTSWCWCLNQAGRAVARRPRTQLMPPLPPRTCFVSRTRPFAVKEDIKCSLSKFRWRKNSGGPMLGYCLCQSSYSDVHHPLKMGFERENVALCQEPRAPGNAQGN